MEKKQAVLLVNFGGPRNLEEISSFLEELLTDQDVIRTSMPSFLHKLIFQQVARRRSKKIASQYAMIGGASPIYEDTEKLAHLLQKQTSKKIIPFHRYLRNTHQEFFKKIKELEADEILVLPLFPQFTYATTGSIARFFAKNLCGKTINKMLWVKSYPHRPSYILAMQQVIKDFLEKKSIKEEEVFLLFSAHGVPQKFICTGDIYKKECEQSFHAIRGCFPKAESALSYQSKFGKGEWVRPYTQDVCEMIEKWNGLQKRTVVVPLSFTSDHIETLFEIEHEYLPILKHKGIDAYRCPALNHHPLWVQALEEMIRDPHSLTTNAMLIRHDFLTRCCTHCPKNECACMKG